MDGLTDLEQEIIACRACPRLVAWREQVAAEKRRSYRDQDYWGKPVPGFGDPQARILIVGLAPGAHGSNRTGRMFTGDASGEFLYQALYQVGFASQPSSLNRNDLLQLKDIFITAVCRCVPPDNRPTPVEIKTCQPYIYREYDLLPIQGIVALGKIAYDQISHFPLFVQSSDERMPDFAHGAFLEPSNSHPWVLASYHPSRQNTQTGRLTPAMFKAIWIKAKTLLG
jgi:uracil-DNA glycosylase